MAQQTPRNQILKTITLPSGKRVDVVSFLDEPGVSLIPVSAPMACCPDCGHDRVQPTGWAEAAGATWRVTLRCPDCEAVREDIFGQAELDEYDIALDEGSRAIAADLDLLARANMADDIDRFTQAMRGDHIVPEDF